MPLFCTRTEIAPDGEILLSGPTVARGARAADGRLHTGDLGRIDERGFLHVTGRKADTIVSGGENVAPSEVEAVLESCPGVLEAAVLGRPDEQWGEAVSAIVVAAAGATLERACRARALRRAPGPVQGAKACDICLRPPSSHRVWQAVAKGVAMGSCDEHRST